MVITFIKKTLKKDTVKIYIKFTNHFEPFYAMAVHKAQGMTINSDYAIYEYDRMKHDMLYVALTRTPNEEYANLCGIKIHRPSTDKFGRAIQELGYNNFEFKKY